jgi:hypothetical protein
MLRWSHMNLANCELPISEHSDLWAMTIKLSVRRREPVSCKASNRIYICHIKLWGDPTLHLLNWSAKSHHERWTWLFLSQFMLSIDNVLIPPKLLLSNCCVLRLPSITNNTSKGDQVHWWRHKWYTARWYSETSSVISGDTKATLMFLLCVDIANKTPLIHSR